MWGAIIGVVGSLHASEQARKLVRDVDQFYDDHPVLVYNLGAREIKSGKCSSCGSRQFQHHNSVLICSYCRSPA